jgi:hypothetical protein
MTDKFSPFRDALESLIGAIPLMIDKDNFPLCQNLEGVSSYQELDDETIGRLQDFCCEHARPSWATGESMMDAADLIVERAIENANINHEGII